MKLLLDDESILESAKNIVCQIATARVQEEDSNEMWEWLFCAKFQEPKDMIKDFEFLAELMTRACDIIKSSKENINETTK